MKSLIVIYILVVGSFYLGGQFLNKSINERAADFQASERASGYSVAYGVNYEQINADIDTGALVFTVISENYPKKVILNYLMQDFGADWYEDKLTATQIIESTEDTQKTRNGAFLQGSI